MTGSSMLEPSKHSCGSQVFRSLSVCLVFRCVSPQLALISAHVLIENSDVFGKKNRSFFHRHDILRGVGLA